MTSRHPPDGDDQDDSSQSASHGLTDRQAQRMLFAEPVEIQLLRLLGIFYGVAAIAFVVGVLFNPSISVEGAYTALQGLLVVFAAMYGVLMFLYEVYDKANVA